MEFFEVIENRRSIRRYKPEPVAREDVLKVIARSVQNSVDFGNPVSDQAFTQRLNHGDTACDGGFVTESCLHPLLTNAAVMNAYIPTLTDSRRCFHY